VIFSQDAELLAVQLQPPGAVTPTDPVPPPDRYVAVVGVRAKLQAEVMVVMSEMVASKDPPPETETELLT
jgi:hypothetical protein